MQAYICFNSWRFFHGGSFPPKEKNTKSFDQATGMKHFRWIVGFDDSKPIFGMISPILVKIKTLKQMLAKNHWKTNCKETVFQWFVTVCWCHSCFCVFCLRQISLSGFANKIPTGLEKVGLYMSFFKAFPWILWRNKTNFTQMMRENIPVISRTPLFPGTWLLPWVLWDVCSQKPWQHRQEGTSKARRDYSMIYQPTYG